MCKSCCLWEQVSSDKCKARYTCHAIGIVPLTTPWPTSFDELTACGIAFACYTGTCHPCYLPLEKASVAGMPGILPKPPCLEHLLSCLHKRHCRHLIIRSPCLLSDYLANTPCWWWQWQWQRGQRRRQQLRGWWQISWGPAAAACSIRNVAAAASGGCDHAAWATVCQPTVCSRGSSRVCWDQGFRGDWS